MVSTRNTRDDVVEAAGRLFAEKGYHGTSMRDLGKELGLLGSSLYSHVDSKQDILVEVVESGAALFQASAAGAMALNGDARQRLHALISGHVAVVLDNLDVARTFLNEARVLDAAHRRRVLNERDAYEGSFRAVIGQGIEEGSLSSDIDPKMAAIFILSILNAIERWYDPAGDVDREQLIEELHRFVLLGLRAGAGQGI